MCAYLVFTNLPGWSGGEGRLWSPFGTSFYGQIADGIPSRPVLIQVWPGASCPFTDPVCNPGGRAEGVEKLAPVALPGACTAQGLPLLPVFPTLLWDNLFSPFHFLGVTHPGAPSQHGRCVSLPYAGETQTFSVPLPHDWSSLIDGGEKVGPSRPQHNKLW